MATIIGNGKAEDEYTHPLGSETNFNESMYFNFFDRKESIGGFIRLGKRANEGRAEMTITLYLPDGRVLFMFDRPAIDNNDSFDAGGARFDVLEPTQRLRTTYQGSVAELKEPRLMADPKRAFAESPSKRVSLDLMHNAVGPLYGLVGAKEQTDRPAEKQFGKAHYEQHMHVTGSLEIDDESYAIDGYGIRDHSWGPRYWQNIQSYEWLTMNFGPDFHAMVSVIDFDGTRARQHGVVVRGDQIDLIGEVEIEAEYEENGLFHKALRTKVKTRSGEELEIEGKVQSFIPLRNRRAGHVTHIGEGMTEWRCGDQIGYGLSEFLRQVE
jgi:hypothetical protein